MNALPFVALFTSHTLAPGIGIGLGVAAGAWAFMLVRTLARWRC
jgi:hypothetical protein